MTYFSVRRWLVEHTLVEPSLLDDPGLATLVAERIAIFGGDEPAYIAELARSPDEVDRLIAGIAVPETWLFRYPRSYELLLEFFKRRLAAGATSLRVLSVGCATGQEPYCIAMTALHAGWASDRVRIEGIDRNAEFLRTAEGSVYGASSIRTEIPAWAVSYLRQSGDRIAIDPAVRTVVRFARIDATAPAALRGTGPFDVVFCRNVLIYLNTIARTRLLDSICAEISPGGLLFVGHAEQVMRGAAPLRPVNAPHAFSLERVDGAPITSGLPPTIHRPVDRPRVFGARTAERAAVVPSLSTRADPVYPPDDSIEAARELAGAGRVQDAEKMIHALIARCGPSAPAMELLGNIRMSVNDTPGAKRLFEQAVYMEPDRSASLLQLALISERSGEANRAAAYWNRARRAPNSHAAERKP